MVRSYWMRFQRFLARNRTALVAILSPFPFFFLSLALTKHQAFWIAAGASYALLVLAAVAPQQYARIELVDTIQPSIFDVCGLKNGDRVTIHRICTGYWRKERYEQLTNYYPYAPGQGRTTSLGKGIVGRCFTQRLPRTWSVPRNKTLAEAVPAEWNFTAAEVAHLSQDRRSFFVHPIGSEGDHARAVLYMDSADSDRFTETSAAVVADKVKRLFLPILEKVLG